LKYCKTKLSASETESDILRKGNLSAIARKSEGGSQAVRYFLKSITRLAEVDKDLTNLAKVKEEGN